MSESEMRHELGKEIEGIRRVKNKELENIKVVADIPDESDKPASKKE